MPSWLLKPLEIVLHLDRVLPPLLVTYGDQVLYFLFFIIFAETGLVVMPFLPGDSLLFTTGAMAALGLLNPFLIWIALSVAAIAGNVVNYTVGRFVGERLVASRWLSKRHYEEAHRFYARSGGMALIFSRFLPIIRTFAPFIAGISRMPFRVFFFYTVIGGIAWVSLFVWAGYFFGNLPFIKERFSTVILVIVGVSFIPFLWKSIQAVWGKNKQP